MKIKISQLEIKNNAIRSVFFAETTSWMDKVNSFERFESAGRHYKTL
jgi:hypothetical protein